MGWTGHAVAIYGMDNVNLCLCFLTDQMSKIVNVLLKLIQIRTSDIVFHSLFVATFIHLNKCKKKKAKTGQSEP